MKKQSIKPRSAKKKKKGGPLVFLFIALFLLIAALVLVRFSGIGAAPGSDSFKQAVGSTQLMQNAKLVKQDLKDIASEMKDNDITSLEFSRRKLDSDVSVLKDYLSTPIWTIAEVVPVVGQDVKTAKALVDISEVFSNDLLRSWVALQKEAPYTELKTEEGYNFELVGTYLDYAEKNLPTAMAMVDRLDKLNLRLVDEDGKITSYLKLVKPVMHIVDAHLNDVIRPGVAVLEHYPPSELKTESGFNIELISRYYSFLSDNLPAVRSLMEELSAVDLSLIDKEGKIGTYLRLLSPLVDVAEEYGEGLIDPGFALLASYPLSEIKTDEGINYEAVSAWSDFLLQNQSALEKLLDDLEGIDFASVEKTAEIPQYISLGKQLLKIGAPANEKLLRPALQLLQEKPLSSIKVDGGFDVRVILAYLDFAEDAFPMVESLTAQLNSLDRSTLDPSGKLEGYLEKITKLQAMYEEYKDYIPAARVILGDGETDRLYVFPAQNSAEIRASGGFPGNVALIRIQNGILTISDFTSGYGAFTPNTPNRAKITAQEVRLFTARMYAPRDVDFCIDFERVAQIWAMAFEDLVRVKPDGIITATPIVIQKLLQASGEPITLSNGMVLDGTTASRVLQRDLYFEYKRAGMDVYAEPDMTDILFGETVKLTLEQISSNMDLSHLLAYVEALRECTEERIVMMWMDDEEEEEIMRQVGWSGSLNSDPEDPKLGIFFSSEQSSKMGYFFDMIPEIGEPVVNEDGSRTYDVTLTLGNVISREEQRIGGTWILGRNYIGYVLGDLTITAPAGGQITDIQLSIPRGMRQETYQGLDTHYIQWLLIERGGTIVITFKVTTAPDVETPLGIMATPTLTKYRS